MNLLALHEAVRKGVRNGEVVEVKRNELNESEQAALVAWQQRLIAAEGDAQQVTPPTESRLWL